jgi:hypothetical protein
MAAFSVLYTVNIAVSNLSLQLVTVPVGHVDVTGVYAIADLRSLLSFV